MRHLLLLVTLLAGCGGKGEPDPPSPPFHYDLPADLAEKSVSYRNLVPSVQDQWGFVGTARCDSLLMTALLGAAGVVTNNAVSQVAPMTFANNDTITISFRAPIAEWAGSGTVNLAQNDVEYLSTSFSSFSAYRGPDGTVLPTTTPAGTYEEISCGASPWQSPQQVGDHLLVEIQKDGSGPWLPLGPATGCEQLRHDGTNYIGLGVYYTSGALRVIRGKYASGTSSAWSGLGSGTRYRIVKFSGGQAVGFGTVSENSSGLMPYSHANLDNATATRLGLKQYLHGTTYNGGAAPTVSYVSGGGSISSVNRGCFVPYQMQDGTWRLKFNINLTVSSTSRSSLKIAVNGVTSHASVDQAFAGAVYTAAAMVNAANTTNNTGNFEISHGTGTATIYGYSGDIELASKPTWAY